MLLSDAKAARHESAIESGSDAQLHVDESLAPTGSVSNDLFTLRRKWILLAMRIPARHNRRHGEIGLVVSAVVTIVSAWTPFSSSLHKGFLIADDSRGTP